jgi:hypothetical protein
MRGDRGQERTCYVNWFRAPQNIWKGLHSAQEWTPEQLGTFLAGQHVRLGAYGDPAAVPMGVWLDVVAQVAGWTGYTHAWRECDRSLRALLMASVDTRREQETAAGAGWRTFRVRGRTEALAPDEVTCPASAEAGHAATCESCGLCRGLAKPSKSVSILVHGSSMKWFPSAAAAMELR